MRYEMTVLRAARAIRHAFNARLEDVGMTVTVATSVAFLVERGLVERCADPADRRVWRIVPTAAAVPYAKKFRKVDADVQRELRIGLDRSDREQLTRLLGRLERNAIAAANRRVEPALQD